MTIVLIIIDRRRLSTERCWDVLSTDERQRAEALCVEEKKQQFIHCRGMLRMLLASELAIEASEIPIYYDVRGKPFVEGGVYFNLSHSRFFAVYAFTSLGPVGVDIEYIDPQLDIDKVAARVFNRSEKQQLESALPDERRTLFFEIWTRKEAEFKVGVTGTDKRSFLWNLNAPLGYVGKLMCMQDAEIVYKAHFFDTASPSPSFDDGQSFLH